MALPFVHADEEQSPVRLRSLEPTLYDDGNLLAYSTDTTGFRQYTLAIKDLTTAGYAAPQAGHLFLKPSTPPSYLHCAVPASCTTTEYKSGTRKHISSLGYTIVADFAARLRSTA